MEIIIFFTAFVAALLSSMSGGGASIITLPVYLFLGMSFPLALAVQKVSGAFWVLPASYNYLKGRKVDWRFIISYSLIGLCFAYLGAVVIVNTERRTLELIIGALILLLSFYTLFQRNLGLQEKKVYSKFRQRLSYLFAPIFGFYESFFGAGGAIMFSIVGFHTRGFDFIDGLGYNYAVAFPWIVLVSVFLISQGYYDLSIMIAAVAGALLGAQVGSRYAKYKGNRFIKVCFVIIGMVLGLKLIIG